MLLVLVSYFQSDYFRSGCNSGDVLWGGSFGQRRKISGADTDIKKFSCHDIGFGGFVSVKKSRYRDVQSVGSIGCNVQYSPLTWSRFDFKTFHGTPSYLEYRHEGEDIYARPGLRRQYQHVYQPL
jgi:hypothetical protein